MKNRKEMRYKLIGLLTVNASEKVEPKRTADQIMGMLERNESEEQEKTWCADFANNVCDEWYENLLSLFKDQEDETLNSNRHGIIEKVVFKSKNPDNSIEKFDEEMAEAKESLRKDPKLMAEFWNSILEIPVPFDWYKVSVLDLKEYKCLRSIESRRDDGSTFISFSKDSYYAEVEKGVFINNNGDRHQISNKLLELCFTTVTWDKK